jgi:hypothetical protein
MLSLPADLSLDHPSFEPGIRDIPEGLFCIDLKGRKVGQNQFFNIGNLTRSKM